jgi:hypothetical protein
MKKVMMVMTIVVALSVLVFMISVASLFAADTTKTTPTTKQQGTTQQGTPRQTPVQERKAAAKMPQSQIENNKTTVHTKFWDFEFDSVEVNGVTIKKGGGNKKIYVKAGQVKFTLHYKLKTPPIKEISEQDVAAWGSGRKHYYNDMRVWYDVNGSYFPGGGSAGKKDLPRFTWADVQSWRKTARSTLPWTWTEQMTLIWNAKPGSNGYTEVYNFFIAFCCVNCVAGEEIAEVDRKNNGFSFEDLLVTLILQKY